jgi:hypothetical protein
MSELKRYQVAFVREEDGELEVIKTFNERDDRAAIRYCDRHYRGEAWYLFDSEGKHVNVGKR